jgi:hypothetical protein
MTFPLPSNIVRVVRSRTILEVEIAFFIALGFVVVPDTILGTPLGAYVLKWVAPNLSGRRLASVYVGFRLYAMEVEAGHREITTPDAALEPYFRDDKARWYLRLGNDAPSAVALLLREYEVNEAAFSKPQDVAPDTILAAGRPSAWGGQSRLALFGDGSIKKVKGVDSLVGKNVAGSGADGKAHD